MSLQEITVENKRSELVAVARGMLEGHMHLLEGVRKICVLRHAVGEPENQVFMPIRAIESETDHFPLGEMRARCTIDYLQRMDDELDRYLADATQDILSACKEIVARWEEDRLDPIPIRRGLNGLNGGRP